MRGCEFQFLHRTESGWRVAKLTCRSVLETVLQPQNNKYPCFLPQKPRVKSDDFRNLPYIHLRTFEFLVQKRRTLRTFGVFAK